MIFISDSFAGRFTSALSECQMIMFSAPCGCGKTVVAHEMLGSKKARFLSADSGELPSPGQISEGIIVIDDLQLMTDADDCDRLCRLIKGEPKKKFLLLSRGTVPGFLMPFSVTGAMYVFGTKDFMLDHAALRRMFDAAGIRADETVISSVMRDTTGYPIAAVLVCRLMADGREYSAAVREEARRELFAYYEEAVFDRLEVPLRRFLLNIAPFESFTIKMAASVSGDPQTGANIDTLTKVSNMFICDDADVYRIYPIFRRFLFWKLERTYSSDEVRELYRRAGLYYELCGDISNALKCYSEGHDRRKVSELLERHAELNPGQGHYYETEPYYRSLSESEILASPSLMCAMSMLSALMTDFDSSERWYGELKKYLDRLSKKIPNTKRSAAG